MGQTALRTREGGPRFNLTPADDFKPVNGWFDLEPQTRALMLEALARFYPEESAEFLAELRTPPATRKENLEVSRQARHARIQRLLPAAVASCAILGTEQKRFADLFFKPDFAQLRPYSMLAFAKFETLLLNGMTGNPRGWEKLWRRGAEALLDIGCRGAHCTEQEAVVAHCGMSLVYACVIVGGEAFQNAWKQVFSAAKRRNALDNQYVNLNLSLLGAFTEVSEPYLHFASSMRNRPVDSADLFLFVRRDLGHECNDLTWKIMLGCPPQPAGCLYSKNPASTISHAIHFIRTSMRRKYYFQNQALTMAVLVWTDSVVETLQNPKVRELIGDRSVEKLERDFARIARVQQMEKNRFRAVIERLPPTRQRRKIEDMWQRTQALGMTWGKTNS